MLGLGRLVKSDPIPAVRERNVQSEILCPLRREEVGVASVTVKITSSIALASRTVPTQCAGISCNHFEIIRERVNGLMRAVKVVVDTTALHLEKRVTAIGGNMIRNRKPISK
jgi:hypothetical protein